MRKAVVVVVVLLLCGPAVAQQTATVIRNVNLRPEPSSYKPAIALLKPPAVVTLLAVAAEDGYLHVQTADGQEGWVWAVNVRLEPGTATRTPDLPVCHDSGAAHARWLIKTQAAPATMPAGGPVAVEVKTMVAWDVPVDLPASARTSNEPITQREADRQVYALTGYVRLIKYEGDCDFHIQVAQSRSASAPQVIVEIPRQNAGTQGEVMRLLDMEDRQATKRWDDPDQAPKLTFVGYAFLDQWHQSKPPSKQGNGHGPSSVKTLWELHPVWEVK